MNNEVIIIRRKSDNVIERTIDVLSSVHPEYVRGIIDGIRRAFPADEFTIELPTPLLEMEEGQNNG